MKNHKATLIDIWQSIKGKEFDYTKISLRKAIVLLSIPMIAEMLMESSFSILDIYFVSKLNDQAIATVGITESIMTLVYAIGIGVSMATTGIVARRIGEKKNEEASNSAAQSILFGVIISLFIGIPGVLYTNDILRFMNASDGIMHQGSSYTTIMIGSNLLIILLFINNAIFRSAGSPVLSMYVLLVANAINIIMDPCLIFGWGPFPELGLKGAAIATVIGRSIGVLLQFYLLFSGKSKVNVNLKHFLPRFDLMQKVVKLSGGGVFQFLIATTSWIFLYRILSAYADPVIAGYTISIRVFIFFMLPSWGFSNAASTLVGQNLGAQKAGRAEKSVWECVKLNSVYMFILTLLFAISPGLFIDFFSISGEAYDTAVISLRIIGLGNVLYGVGMIMGQAFNGAGDTYTPSIMNFIAFWIIEIPLAYFLSNNSDLNEKGVFYAIMISEILLAFLFVYFFTRGKWKLRVV